MDLSRRQATLAALGVVALAAPAMAQAGGSGDSVDALKALLAAHNKAFTNQDLAGVLATLSPDVAIIGTAPGEIWVGHTEATDAYTHFFTDFDPGKQSFEDLWHQGNVGPNGAWLMTMSKVTLQKEDKKTEFGLNLSMVCEKRDGKWLIRAMHFSNLTSKA